MINKVDVADLKFDFETKGVVIPNESCTILANHSLMNFLCFILKKRNNQMTPVVESLSVNDNYLTFHLLCENIEMTETERSLLFSLSSKDFDFLVIRQILRDIGNASNHFATGIIVRRSGTFVYYDADLGGVGIINILFIITVIISKIFMLLSCFVF